MAQPFVTGAVPIFCGVGGSASPIFLGHSERYPRIEIRPSFSPVFVDVAGQKVPYDYVYDGEEAYVTADVTRFNEATYAIIADRAATNNTNGLAILRGNNAPGEIGTLMVTEGIAYGLWLPFFYSTKAAMATMPPGYHFAAAFLEGPDTLDPLGTAPRKIHMVWHCVRKFDTTQSNSFGWGGFNLYDNNPASFVGLPPAI